MEPHNNNFIARKYKNFDQARSDEMCLFFLNLMLARQLCQFYLKRINIIVNTILIVGIVVNKSFQYFFLN